MKQGNLIAPVQFFHFLFEPQIILCADLVFYFLQKRKELSVFIVR